ncbi:hypothetical protein PNEG_02669 [Pneumocystis murina B123]|uniref:Uncharacterized protein n=1 Tax=Pneumocystis murina (strain B123) TaxID=1069680 RepID=M7P4X0_PNEMU|nr:hypothetical protein PNEG_02669 [Pneumocystis murina B123]EMR08885.1 hypothetical protein PNEG_02669 [Pneumocystis murina B123]
MKLFIIPITRNRFFLYCHQNSIHSKPSLIDKFTNKVGDLWKNWGQSEIKWKKRLVELGNKIVDSLPYEEWSLRNIPSRKKVDQIQGTGSSQYKVTVHYPTSIGPEKAIFTISDLVERRALFHKRWMIFSIIGTPFTLPLALIPIIPNIPGFYLLYRAYSHWKAFHGAQHLKYLLKNNLFYPSASSSLEKVYGNSLQNTTHDDFLLNTTKISIISRIIDNKDFKMHLERAIRQLQKENSLQTSNLSMSL